MNLWMKSRISGPNEKSPAQAGLFQRWCDWGSLPGTALTTKTLDGSADETGREQCHGRRLRNRRLTGRHAAERHIVEHDLIGDACKRNRMSDTREADARWEEGTKTRGVPRSASRRRCWKDQR